MNKKLFEPPQCTICLDSLAKDLLTISHCGHVYHAQCLYQANEHKNTCPICRTRYQAQHMVKLLFQLEEISDSSLIMEQQMKNLSEDDKLSILNLLKQQNLDKQEKVMLKNELESARIKMKDLEDKYIIIKQDFDALQERYQKIRETCNKKSTDLERCQQQIVDFNETLNKQERELQKYKNNYLELNQFKICKEITERNDYTEQDSLIKKIKLTQSIEEQAKSFYSMLSIKLGEFRETEKNYRRLERELNDERAALNKLKSDLKEKENDLKKQKIPLVPRVKQDDITLTDSTTSEKGNKIVSIPHLEKIQQIGNNFRFQKKTIQSSQLNLNSLTGKF